MDDRDNLLVDLLVKDPRSSLSALAQSMGISVTAVSKRLKKLEDDGYIRFEVSVNIQKFKLSHAIMLIETKDALSRAEIIERYASCPLVDKIFDIIGFEYHLLVCLISPDPALMANFMTYCPIRYMDGIKRINGFNSLIDTHKPFFLPIKKKNSEEKSGCEINCAKDCNRYKRLCPGCPAQEYKESYESDIIELESEILTSK